MNFLQTIKDKIDIKKTIDKLFKELNTVKYFLVKKENFWIPRELLKKDGYSLVNIFFDSYPVNKTYYLIKVQAEYVKNEQIKRYNNTSLLNGVTEMWMQDDYFWVYNIYKYFIGQKDLQIGGKKVFLKPPEGVEDDKYSKKLLRYNFIQEIVDTYNKNLSKVYKNDINYIDITTELFYYKNQKKIKGIIKLLKKIGFSKKKSYSTIMEYDWYEETKKYKRFEKILNIYKKDKKIYPLMFEYLDSNLNQSVYLFDNKEEVHKIFKINDIEEFLSTNTKYDYIIYKGNIMINFPLYIYFLEKIFFKTFLKLRNVSKLKLNFNEKLNLDKIERLPLLMGQLLAHNTILVELIKLYNVFNNNVILWSKNYLLWYSLWHDLSNVTSEIDQDIKNILKGWEYGKLIKSDYIKEPLEKELFKYNLDYIWTDEAIFRGKI